VSGGEPQQRRPWAEERVASVVTRLRELADDLEHVEGRARADAAGRSMPDAGSYVAGWVAGEARATSFELERLAAQLRGDR